MAEYAELELHRRSIEQFGACGLLGPGAPVEHRHSLPPAQVALPPIHAGRLFLEKWPLRELPDQGMWRATQYQSYAPPLFVFSHALVHSNAGIIAVQDQVVAETLTNASPGTHGFRNLARGIVIQIRSIKRLSGAYISLLGGGAGNYFHAALGGIARLLAVPENYQAAAAGLLVPKGGLRQAELLALLDVMPSLRIIEVEQRETLLIDTLILPLSVAGEMEFHPIVAEFYRAISANVPPPPRGRMPRRLYIDRRGTSARPLRNENAVIKALAPYGFVPVQLEHLSVADQAGLFRAAEMVVAPHGAGVTNIGFCRPGTQIIELQMDAYCNWTYRHLAGLMQLQYDCVMGRARQPWPELDLALHMLDWEISENHVAAAVAQYLPQAAAA